MRHRLRYFAFLSAFIASLGAASGTAFAETIPYAPSGQAAAATSSSTIRVTWHDNSTNETGFRIYNGAGFAYVGANATSYTQSGLYPGKYMCFAVQAYNSAGYSAWTPYACVTIPTVPNAPSGISAVAISTNAITVRWYDNSTNETGFRVYNGVNSYYLGANNTSFTWSSLAPGTYMCFSVSAYNVSGYSAGTPWGCATTPASTSREQKAMDWARSVIGQYYTNYDLGDSNHVWNGWCYNFVAHAYGRSASGYYTAIDHYNDLRNRGMIHTSGTPPSGALVFFGTAAINNYAGHVMLSEGNGYYITAAWPVQRVTLSWPGAPYLGWSYANPEWPGR
jgi:hypothetical protein